MSVGKKDVKMQAGTDAGLRFQGTQGTVVLPPEAEATGSTFVPGQEALPGCCPLHSRRGAISVTVQKVAGPPGTLDPGFSSESPSGKLCAQIYFVLCVNGTPWRCAEGWPWCGDGGADVHTGAPNFMAFSIIALRRHCVIFFFFFFFYKLKVCGNPFDAGKSVRITFPTAFAQFMSLCHILVIFQIFRDYYIC